MTADGKIHVRADSNFVERSRTAKKGEKLANGACRVGNSQKLAKGESGSEYIAEFDPNTCDFVVAEGSWRIEPASWRYARTALSHPVAQPNTRRESTSDQNGLRLRQSINLLEPTIPQTPRNDQGFGYGGVLPCCLWYEQMGVWQQLNTEDPVDLNVATTQFWFQFGWDNSSGHVFGPASGNFEYYWFLPTGWYPPQTSWERFDDDWFSTGIRTYADYSNLLFCSPVQYTFAHHMISARGEPYFVWIDWYYDVNGDCSNLLTTTHDYYAY